MKDDFKGSVLKTYNEFVVILSNGRYIDFIRYKGSIELVDFNFNEDTIDRFSKLKMKNGELE